MVSQFEQDSFVKALFARSGSTIHSVVESGCSFPNFHCNSQLFFQESSCDCFLIEGKLDCVQAWREYLSLNNFPAKVNILSEFIQYRPTGLSDALSKLPSLPNDFDVFFFDINGGEYQLFSNQFQYRPKLICVEYDNAYPLCIDHVPQFFGCSPNYGQASSLAFFKMMEERHYIYVRSFFQDHIFISQEFYESSNLSEDTHFLAGREAFLHYAADALYDPIAVFTNQMEGECAKSFKFYSDKLDSLLFNDSHQSASFLFSYLLTMIKVSANVIQSKRNVTYASEFASLKKSFIEKYSPLILV